MWQGLVDLFIVFVDNSGMAMYSNIPTPRWADIAEIEQTSLIVKAREPGKLTLLSNLVLTAVAQSQIPYSPKCVGGNGEMVIAVAVA